jgi:hypothetical protein
MITLAAQICLKKVLLLLRRRKPFTENATLIIGHPGVGKTTMLDLIADYVLSGAWAHGFIVLARTARGTAVATRFDTQEQGVEVQWFRTVEAGVDEVRRMWDTKRSRKVLVLHDCNGYATYDHEAFGRLDRVGACGAIVYASSPLEQNHKTFKKMTAPSTFYFPPLTRSESMRFVASFATEPSVDPAAAEARFHNIGGVMRHLRSMETAESAAIEAEIALRAFKFDGNFLNCSMSSTSSKVTVMVPNPTFDNFTFDFASARIRDKWIEATVWTERADAKEFYTRARDAKCTNDVCGRLFETVALRQLRSSPQFCSSWQLLPPNGKKPSTVLPSRLASDLPGRGKNTAFGGNKLPVSEIIFAAGGTSYTMFEPKLSNFTMLDAVIAGQNSVLLVQVTVAAKHNPKATQLVDLGLTELLDEAELKSYKVSVAWVVPFELEPNRLISWQQISPDAKHQPVIDRWEKLAQYVIEVPTIEPEGLSFMRYYHKKPNKITTSSGPGTDIEHTGTFCVRKCSAKELTGEAKNKLVTVLAIHDTDSVEAVALGGRGTANAPFAVAKC